MKILLAGRMPAVALRSRPMQRAAVLGAVKAKPLRVAAKTRPALTAPCARRRSKLWSGRKNARGAGQTKESRKAISKGRPGPSGARQARQPNNQQRSLRGYITRVHSVGGERMILQRGTRQRADRGFSVRHLSDGAGGRCGSCKGERMER
jgi:hypothetical protein